MAKGFQWIADGFGYFMRSPLQWVLVHVVLFIVGGLTSSIPFANLLVFLLSPLIAAGFFLGCQQMHQTGQGFRFGYIFTALKSPHIKQLLLLGLFQLAVNFILIAISSVWLISSLAELGLEQNPGTISADEAMLILREMTSLILVIMILATPYIMAMWFATTLVVLDGVSALRALLLSFKACLANIAAFTLYGLVMLLLCIPASIPLFLGFFVLLPVMVASIYLAYLDCFQKTDVESGSPEPPTV